MPRQVRSVCENAAQMFAMSCLRHSLLYYLSLPPAPRPKALPLPRFISETAAFPNRKTGVAFSATRKGETVLQLILPLCRQHHASDSADEDMFQRRAEGDAEMTRARYESFVGNILLFSRRPPNINKRREC